MRLNCFENKDIAPIDPKLLNLVMFIATAVTMVAFSQQAKGEGTTLELEAGFTIPLPYQPPCPNPFEYPDGRLRLAKEFRLDSHGHVIPAEAKDCNDGSSPFTLGASYKRVISFEDENKGETSDVEGVNEEGAHGDGHPVNVIMMNVGIRVFEEVLTLSPKVGFSLPLSSGEEFQVAPGGTVVWHPDKNLYHELFVAGHAWIGHEGLSIAEVQVGYMAKLTDQFGAGVGCLAEFHLAHEDKEEENESEGGKGGHKGPSWGCGPSVEVRVTKLLSFFYDGAYGPGLGHHHFGIAYGGHGH